MDRHADDGGTQQRGAPALPQILAALANTNQLSRDRIAFYLAATMARDLGTDSCLPPLMAALNDPYPEVRSTAS